MDALRLSSGQAEAARWEAARFAKERKGKAAGKLISSLFHFYSSAALRGSAKKASSKALRVQVFKQGRRGNREQGSGKENMVTG